MLEGLVLEAGRDVTRVATCFEYLLFELSHMRVSVAGLTAQDFRGGPFEGAQVRRMQHGVAEERFSVMALEEVSHRLGDALRQLIVLSMTSGAGYRAMRAIERQFGFFMAAEIEKGRHKAVHRVASLTCHDPIVVGRHLAVVGVYVAVDAVRMGQAFELRRLAWERTMTALARNFRMSTLEWKIEIVVKTSVFRFLVDDVPTFGAVAVGAAVAEFTFVYVLVAVDTTFVGYVDEAHVFVGTRFGVGIGRAFRIFQRLMAFLTVDFFVVPCERKIAHGAVIEFRRLLKFLRAVTFFAALADLPPMFIKMTSATLGRNP